MRRQIEARLIGRCALGLALSGALWWGAAVGAQDMASNEGGDVAFGGPGQAPGQFLELRDITFDARGLGYALDGTRINPQTKAREGNLRVQKFDASGKILGAFSIASDALGDRQDPQRLAALSDGTVFITQPQAGVLQVLAPDGKPRPDIALPYAMAITVVGSGAQERIAVLPSRHEIVEGKWAWLGGDKIVVLKPGGEVESTIALEQKLEGVQDLTADRAGNFYVQAEPNAIYKFSPAGQRLKTWGGNPTTRNPDGSEVLHTVAVDSKGNVYTMAWGNPGRVTRFDAEGTRVTQREGQFKWADPWSVHSGYVPLAIDPSDRLWAGATHRFDADYVHIKTQRAAPAIVRARADFFEAPANAIQSTPVRMLGFKPSVSCGLPDNIAYEANKPISMAIAVAPAKRSVSAVLARWEVTDMEKKEVARGQVRIGLEDGAEAKASFSWTPPRLGYYFVRCAFETGGQPMGALGEHVGVTARFANMPALAQGEAAGGWTDAPRQMWSGLPNMRIHPSRDGKEFEKTDQEIALAEKAGATYFLQLVDNLKDLTPEHVRRVVSRYKGRVKYYEVCNEPNFSGDIDKYFQGHKMAYGIIKEVDPQAQVMGPGTVNIDLNWLKRLYELGFKDVSDIISLHDYEGHESITPEHWKWKLGQVRAIMAANGDGAKPIWQTERAISGVRGNNFQGLAQAIRTTLHRDLLETLGIPSEHNNHYYLNQGGYSGVPTYIWSAQGPHPAALALRVRHAMTSALSRKYLGALDFGATGNTFLMGTRYNNGNGNGETVVLRNLGASDLPTAFAVRGATALDVVDCWGNAAPVRVAQGRASLELGQMPLYVRLAAGQSMVPLKLDFGRNVAQGAAWKYSAPSKNGDAILTNGVYETYHSGNPNGDTDGAKIWTGDLPLDAKGQVIPQTLEASFGQAQLIDKVIVRGVRGDNQFCALLDYDLDFYDGREWKSIAQVRSTMPASEEATSADATHAIWMDDTNLFVHRFPAVRAERLRLVARRASFGFIPDDRAKAWGNVIPPKLMLREFEAFAPTATAPIAARDRAVHAARRSASTSTSAASANAARLVAQAKMARRERRLAPGTSPSASRSRAPRARP